MVIKQNIQQVDCNYKEQIAILLNKQEFLVIFYF